MWGGDMPSQFRRVLSRGTKITHWGELKGVPGKTQAKVNMRIPVAWSPMGQKAGAWGNLRSCGQLDKTIYPEILAFNYQGQTVHGNPEKILPWENFLRNLLENNLQTTKITRKISK